MGGLVPLLLVASPSSSRTSSILGLASPDTPNSYSYMFPSYRNQLSPTHRPRRPTFDMPALSSPVPSTPEEWRKAIDDVKLKYTNRKYRSCSARCIELLSDPKSSSTAEPVYLVSLHFYAAVSLETCARPLSPSSSFRTKLYRDARDHYDQAEALIRKSEEITVEKTRSASVVSYASGTRTPDLCHDSQSEVSTSPSSPRSSICSIDGALKKNTVKPKKKVSFSGLPDLETTRECPPEPFIRPDSPTLGLDAFCFSSKPKSTDLEISELETFPVPPSTSPVVETPEVCPLETIPVADAEIVETVDASQIEHMNRLCAQMSSLRSQIIFHRDAVDVILAQPVEAQATPIPFVRGHRPSQSTSSVPIQLVLPSLRARSSTLSSRGNWPPRSSSAVPWSRPTTLHDEDDQVHSRPATPDHEEYRSGTSTPPRSGSSMSMYSTGRPGTSMSCRSRSGSVASNYSTCSDDALRERIERLRANGWKRKRFDGSRYEALRESVLDEMNN